MYIDTSQNISIPSIDVTAIEISSQPGWNYQIKLGDTTRIYLSRTELMALTNQSIRLLNDAWATEDDDAE